MRAYVHVCGVRGQGGADLAVGRQPLCPIGRRCGYVQSSRAADLHACRKRRWGRLSGLFFSLIEGDRDLVKRPCKMTRRVSTVGYSYEGATTLTGDANVPPFDYFPPAQLKRYGPVEARVRASLGAWDGAGRGMVCVCVFVCVGG